MRLCIRPPRETEWPLCRMLLPETFADVAGRSYLLALRDEAPRVVAAACFRERSGAVTELRVHVVPAFRRRGVGSAILEHIARPGLRAMEGTAEILQDPAAAAFCTRNRFQRVDALTTVEAEMAAMCESMRRLRDRFVLPPGASTIPLSAAPVDQVASLHAQYVAQQGDWNFWRGFVGQARQMDISPVVMLHDRVVGILLGNVEGETAIVRSRVVAPGLHGGWVNATLLAQALDIGWAAGARRTRFFFTDSNSDTRKLAARFHAQVTSVVARFVRNEA